MSDISARGLKSRESRAREKLVRMLQNMLPRSPNTFLRSTPEGFGAWSAEGNYLHVVFNGRWTNEDLRDYLVLFATLLAVDPEKLGRADENRRPHNGVSLTGRAQ